jgi:hypothetical protein
MHDSSAYHSPFEPDQLVAEPHSVRQTPVANISRPLTRITNRRLKSSRYLNNCAETSTSLCASANGANRGSHHPFRHPKSSSNQSSTGDVNQLPVTSNGHLEGVVSRGHVMWLLQTRAELNM